MIPTVPAADAAAIPGLDVTQMIEVDRAMVEAFGIAAPPVFATSDLVRLT